LNCYLQKNLDKEDQIRRLKGTAESYTEPVVQTMAIYALKEYEKRAIEDNMKLVHYFLVEQQRY
jgi:hypothetical protein